MTKTRLIIALGLIVAVLPFLGFPGDMEDALVSIFGLMLAALGYLSGRRASRRGGSTVTPARTTGMFVDNRDEHERAGETDEASAAMPTEATEEEKEQQ